MCCVKYGVTRDYVLGLEAVNGLGEAVSLGRRTGDEAARARAQLAFEDILDDAIALGGTVTGEHGVGLLKMRGMDKELGPAVLGMHHAVKAALDPHGILNPGKVLGSGPASAV